MSKEVSTTEYICFNCGASGSTCVTTQVQRLKNNETPCLSCGKASPGWVIKELIYFGEGVLPRMLKPEDVARIIAPQIPNENVPDNSQKTPKHHKDTTKPPMSMVQGDFLAAMACNMRAGVKDGRQRGDWMRLEWGGETRAHYMDALLRHAHIDFDPVAVACNAMIIWYNDRKMKRQDKKYDE